MSIRGDITVAVISSVAILVSAVNYLLLLAFARRLVLVQRELVDLRRGTDPTRGDGRIEAPGIILQPGERVDPGWLQNHLPEYGTVDRTLVGFFSVDCSACMNQVAPFNRSRAAGQTLQRVAVIAGPDKLAKSYVNELDESTVIRLTGSGRDPLHEVFQVTGFPSFALVDNHGLVIASGWEVAGVVNVGAQ